MRTRFLPHRRRAWRAALAGLAGATLGLCGPALGQDGDAPPASEDEPAGRTLGSTEELQTGVGAFDRETHPGHALFTEHCGACHYGGVPKAPHFSWLEMMSADSLFTSMQSGVMQPQSAHLSEREQLDIVAYIVRQEIDGAQDVAQPEPPMCEADRAGFDLASPPPAVNWGHDTARYSPPEVAGLSADDAGKLELKWAFAFPGALRARSQPSIAMGAVFVGSQDGTVYAFDLETGCAKWTFKASAEVRTAIVLTAYDGDADAVDPEAAPLAFFGDILARFYAVNALTGELVWSIKADDHPSATLTGSPAYHDGQLYIPVSSLEVIGAADPAYECCTFRGKVIKADARTGEIAWEHFTIPEPPSEYGRTSVGTRILSPSGAPIWSSPAVDPARNVIYVGTGENYSTPADGNSDAILAIDMDAGTRVWTRQSTAGDAWNVACMMVDNPNCPEEDGPDFDHGSSMILVDVEGGGQVLLAGHKDGTVFGLDPDNDGALLWSTRVGRGSIQGGIHFGMAVEGERVFAPINDMNDTANGDFLDPELARPGVHAIDVATGEVAWSHVQEDVCPEELQFCDPGVSSAVTAAPGVLFAGHLDGVVRAYDSADGEVLWEFDTKQDIEGVNGVIGRGGSMSGAGPAVADGHLAINSGYGLYTHEAGNLFLVFAPAAP
ncbi:MAG: PQQ-binding-like beta-propeller repeat protein [Caulobacterales bacterium]|nr:PQQ-binding-like beta-propeller repeat protein [Caulobacterales bacterium]